MKPASKQVIPAGEFKAKCLRLMDDVQRTGEPIEITKHGKPVVRVVPVEKETQSFRPLFGRGKGWMTIKGDIISPACPEEDWEVFSE